MIKQVLLTPIQKFIKIESFSGILLLSATLIALLWANSSAGDLYQDILQYKIGFSIHNFELYKPLILWINDGLMAVFFFLIGLEIKREFLIGELNSAKKIAFPLLGAIGGMAFPVLFYTILNQNPETQSGWGIPMATDIAFSLAVLKILGDRIPLSLKVFLTAFAIVDDLGAVLVIALFYSANINIMLLVAALGLLAVLYVVSAKGYYSTILMILFGIVIWYLFLKSGIHPTLAGILLAFSVPIRQKIDTPEFLSTLTTITDSIKGAVVLKEPILSKEQLHQVDNLSDWTGKYQSPLQKLEHSLHGWVAYFIIPVFALANAGVLISGDIDLDTDIMRNIIISLVLGNSIGITTLVLLAKKAKLIEVPKDISNRQIVGVSFLAGIGFTMAIFIASLALDSSPLFLDSAKIGVLIGSLISAIIGLLILNSKKSKTT